MEQKLKAVIFDWDNTLVDTLAHLVYALDIVISTFGNPNLDMVSAMQSKCHRSCKDLFPEIFGTESDKATELYYKSYNHSVAQKGIIPLKHSEEVLQFLNKCSIPVAIVSNKVNNLLNDEIKKLGWEKYFSAIVGSKDAARDKPHADPAYLALELLKVKPSLNVLFIGDSIADIQCANNSNCLPVLFGNKEEFLRINKMQNTNLLSVLGHKELSKLCQKLL